MTDNVDPEVAQVLIRTNQIWLARQLAKQASEMLHNASSIYQFEKARTMASVSVAYSTLAMAEGALNASRT